MHHLGKCGRRGGLLVSFVLLGDRDNWVVLENWSRIPMHSKENYPCISLIYIKFYY